MNSLHRDPRNKRGRILEIPRQRAESLHPNGLTSGQNIHQLHDARISPPRKDYTRISQAFCKFQLPIYLKSSTSSAWRLTANMRRSGCGTVTILVDCRPELRHGGTRCAIGTACFSIVWARDWRRAALDPGSWRHASWTSKMWCTMKGSACALRRGLPSASSGASRSPRLGGDRDPRSTWVMVSTGAWRRRLAQLGPDRVARK